MSRKTVDAWLESQDARTLVLRTDTGDGTKDLFFKSDRDIWRRKIDNLDFAIVALSHYASALGRDLRVRGTVSRSQMDHIEELVQIWSNWRPDLFRRIDISADGYIGVPASRDLPAAMAFSGGVDASFSLVAHKEKMLGHLSKDIRCGVLAVGWDLKHGNDAAKDIAYAKARESLSSFGVECVAIATNWQQDFCPNWFMGFNIAVSSMLQTLSNHYSCGIMAGDLSYVQEVGTGPHGSHMVVNHLLGSAGFPIITTGGTHSRLERVAVLSKYPTLLKNLRVCYQEDAGGGNCGVCEKCVRTSLELIASGIEPSVCFPGQPSADAVSNICTGSIAAVMFLEEILDRFPKHHELYAVLREAVARERIKYRAKEVTDAVDQLETSRSENARLLGYIGDVKHCRSWRYTEPLRRASGIARKVKSALARH